jgi:hypothetical protein
VKQNITSNGTPMAKKISWHANLRYIWQPTIYNSSSLRAKWQYRVSRVNKALTNIKTKNSFEIVESLDYRKNIRNFTKTKG